MPIFLTTGTPGSFKTLSTIGRVIKRQQDDAKAGMDRPVYACNIKGLTVPGWETFEHGYDWPECPDGSIIVIDECQKEDMGFGRMSTTAKVPPHIALLEDHRHRGIDIYLITQGPHLINSHIKPLVGTHWHYLRKHGWDRAHCYTSDGIIKNPETKSSLAGLEKTIYKPDKSLYQYYDSATLHTVQKRIPQAIKYGVPALAVFGLVIFWGFKTVAGLADKGKAEIAPETASAVQTLQGVPQDAFLPVSTSAPPSEGFNPLVAFVPRIEAMPETAPAYDELRKPQDFPRPQCVLHPKSGGCNCYTQQATLMADYPKDLCMAYVKHGYFDATKPRAQARGFERREVARQENVASGGGINANAPAPPVYMRSDSTAMVPDAFRNM